MFTIQGRLCLQILGRSASSENISFLVALFFSLSKSIYVINKINTNKHQSVYSNFCNNSTAVESVYSQIRFSQQRRNRAKSCHLSLTLQGHKNDSFLEELKKKIILQLCLIKPYHAIVALAYYRKMWKTSLIKLCHSFKHKNKIKFNWLAKDKDQYINTFQT